MIARRDVFQAIADPTRRAILDKLAGQTLNLSDIQADFSISQPAISKHMKILHECGLIRITKQGREHLCTAELHALQEVVTWANQYRDFWNNRLDKLEQLLNDDQ